MSLVCEGRRSRRVQSAIRSERSEQLSIRSERSEQLSIRSERSEQLSIRNERSEQLSIGSRAVVLRRSERTCLWSARDDEVGGFRARSAASGASN